MKSIYSKQSGRSSSSTTTFINSCGLQWKASNKKRWNEFKKNYSMRSWSIKMTPAASRISNEIRMTHRMKHLISRSSNISSQVSFPWLNQSCWSILKALQTTTTNLKWLVILLVNSGQSWIASTMSICSSQKTHETLANSPTLSTIGSASTLWIKWKETSLSPSIYFVLTRKGANFNRQYETGLLPWVDKSSPEQTLGSRHFQRVPSWKGNDWWAVFLLTLPEFTFRRTIVTTLELHLLIGRLCLVE
jgi:hypothetical protein